MTLTERQLNEVVQNHQEIIKNLEKALDSLIDKADKAETCLNLAKLYARLANDFYAVKNGDGVFELTTRFRVVNKEDKKEEE